MQTVLHTNYTTEVYRYLMININVSSPHTGLRLNMGIICKCWYRATELVAEAVVSSGEQRSVAAGARGAWRLAASLAGAGAAPSLAGTGPGTTTALATGIQVSS